MTDELKPLTIDDIESFLADRLSIIEEGKGNWAACIQLIERYAESRRTPDARLEAERAVIEAVKTMVSDIDEDGCYDMGHMVSLKNALAALAYLSATEGK